MRAKRLASLHPKSQSPRSRRKSSRLAAVPLALCDAPDVSQKAGPGRAWELTSGFFARLALSAISLPAGGWSGILWH